MAKVTQAKLEKKNAQTKTTTEKNVSEWTSHKTYDK